MKKLLSKTAAIPGDHGSLPPTSAEAFDGGLGEVGLPLGAYSLSMRTHLAKNAKPVIPIVRPHDLPAQCRSVKAGTPLMTYFNILHINTMF